MEKYILPLEEAVVGSNSFSKVIRNSTDLTDASTQVLIMHQGPILSLIPWVDYLSQVNAKEHK